MSSSGPTAISTPKRKRTQLDDDDAGVPLLNAFSPRDIALPPSSPADDGSTSPRTKVAHRFRSLAIGRSRSSAEAITHPRFAPATRDFTTTMPETPQPGSKSHDAMEEDTDEMDHGARKRLKVPQDDDEPQPWPRVESDLPPLPQEKSPRKPEAPAPAFAVDRPATPPLRKPPTSTAQDSTGTTPTAIPPSATPLQPGPPGFQWPPSPPDTTTTSLSPPQTDNHPITVAFRASMTWQEDEITIYDPDDSDDDGTGINGIGFKPTAAVAYARGVKRKQQLAEYRKREEREARARRSQRRRGPGSPRPPPPAAAEKVDNGFKDENDKMKEKDKERRRRKVRFLEASVAASASVATSS